MFDELWTIGTRENLTAAFRIQGLVNSRISKICTAAVLIVIKNKLAKLFFILIEVSTPSCSFCLSEMSSASWIFEISTKMMKQTTNDYFLQRYFFMRLCFPSLILAVEWIIVFEGKFVDFVTGRQEIALPPLSWGIWVQGWGACR